MEDAGSPSDAATAVRELEVQVIFYIINMGIHTNVEN